MKVTIINSEEVKNIFENWGTFAATCYDTPKKFAERVGQSCLKSGHFSGSRADYIKFDISGVSRACVDQMVRHEIGVVKNVMSGRYVDFSEFEYYTPPIVETDEILKDLYHSHMAETKLTYKAIVKRLNELDIKGEKAFEVARGVSPMNHHTSLTIGFTIEALINFMHKRLCKCAQHEIRQLAMLMKKEVQQVLPQLSKMLVPICADKGYCPENPKRSCNLYPQREVVETLMNEYRRNIQFRNMIDEKIEGEVKK